jgi:hypothetical protein
MRPIIREYFWGGADHPLTTPEGFSWHGQDPEANFFLRPDGTIGYSFDTEARKVAAEVSYYVDTATGNNSNSGLSWALAVKSINTAMASAKAGGVPANIFVKAGTYMNGDWLSNAQIVDVPCNLIAVDGPVRVLWSNTTAWTLTSAQTFTHQTTQANAAGCIDLLNTDPFGGISRLTLRGSIAEVEANPGSYWVSGTTVYVHTFNSRVPTAADCVATRTNIFAQFQNAQLYVEGFEFLGSHNNGCVFVTGTGDVCFVRCRFGVNFGTARPVFRHAKNTPHRCWMVECRAFSGNDDGFNYDPVTPGVDTTGPCMELDCAGWYCGTASGNDNISTMHNGGSIIRVNTFAFGSGRRNIHDVQAGTMAWNMGCVAGLAQNQSAAEDSAAFMCGSFSTGGATLWWCDSCTSLGGVLRDWSVNSVSTLRFARTDYASGTNNFAGTVEDYGPAKVPPISVGMRPLVDIARAIISP